MKLSWENKKININIILNKKEIRHRAMTIQTTLQQIIIERRSKQKINIKFMLFMLK